MRGIAALAGAALLATACASATGGQPPPTSAPVPSAHAAAALYLAIARPANRHLDHDFDALKDDSRDNLQGATAALRDAAATERLFDRKLLRIALPPDVETVARVLVAANESRARLTDAAARSASLAALRRYQPRLTAANGPVEQAVRVIRSQLDLPPPSTS